MPSFEPTICLSIKIVGQTVDFDKKRKKINKPVRYIKKENCFRSQCSRSKLSATMIAAKYTVLLVLIANLVLIQAASLKDVGSELNEAPAPDTDVAVHEKKDKKRVVEVDEVLEPRAKEEKVQENVEEDVVHEKKGKVPKVQDDDSDVVEPHAADPDMIGECNFDFMKDLANPYVLYLKPTSYDWFYAIGKGPIHSNAGPFARLACTAGKITVGSELTKYKSVLVQCVNGKTVQIVDTEIQAKLRDIGCSAYQEPITRLTKHETAIGKTVAQVGFRVDATHFVPVIDEIAVSRISRGYIPRWAHYSVMPLASMSEQKAKSKLKLKYGPLSGETDYKLAYDRMYQRQAMKVIFKGDKIVDKYMPLNGSDYFVPAQLVDPEDFVFEAQSNATVFYELTTPVWRSVAEGNWALTDRIIRDYSRKHYSKVDVFSGTYLALYLPDKIGLTTYVTLPEDLRPAQFLFRYAVDKSTRQGVVFVTVNNPHLESADQRNVICEPLDKCQQDYEEFADFKQGYTYCCSTEDFDRHAKRLGLPLVEPYPLVQAL
uniref:DNA/RNA non-specific endonuclease/pyrophosphatase/phosphodiesterase domain-containing protein n=1 Tax=Trichogramma kaykai TaxID=54128 RepID=A0ABD2X3A5_9HYME